MWFDLSRFPTLDVDWCRETGESDSAYPLDDDYWPADFFDGFHAKRLDRHAVMMTKSKESVVKPVNVLYKR